MHNYDHLGRNPQLQDIRSNVRRSLSKRDNPIPLVITNNCPETIWPGVATQHGDRPESQGFELTSGATRKMSVGPDWQGRVWGRTNCTVSNDTATCSTGDCFGRLDCEYGGTIPVTLAEFNLAGGTLGKQTFYDLSLVDGYNLPIGVVYIPAVNTSEIPPNLVNAACIATTGYLMPPNRTGLNYTNSSYPMPYETSQTNTDIGQWCPWDLQAFPPDKPGDGIYPYPDDNVKRPVFDPCKSACAATNDPKDCCTGKFNEPSLCKPSLYSHRAKTACPDAYSYAFDDQDSTFIIPSGGGWEVVFCPAGRSTNILRTFGAELSQIGSSGMVTEKIKQMAMNVSYIESVPSAASDLKLPLFMIIVAVAVVGFLSL